MQHWYLLHTVTDGQERGGGACSQSIYPESCFYFKQTEKKEKHLIIMVHGLHGNRYDMRGFKNNLNLLYPNIIFLIS